MSQLDEPILTPNVIAQIEERAAMIARAEVRKVMQELTSTASRRLEEHRNLMDEMAAADARYRADMIDLFKTNAAAHERWRKGMTYYQIFLGVTILVSAYFMG